MELLLTILTNQIRKEMIKMELKYTKTSDYELQNLTLNDNKKGAINKYGMLRLDYLK